MLLRRSSVYRAAKSDSGHLPPLAASRPHSNRTITLRIAAQRNRRNKPATGKSKMLAARDAQNHCVQELNRRQH